MSNNQGRNRYIETDTEITDKEDFKALLNVLKDSKKNVNIMKKEMKSVKIKDHKEFSQLEKYSIICYKKKFTGWHCRRKDQ